MAEGARRKTPVGERLAVVEERLDAVESLLGKLDARLWWLVTSAAGVGSVAGAAAATGALQAFGG